MLDSSSETSVYSAKWGRLIKRIFLVKKEAKWNVAGSRGLPKPLVTETDEKEDRQASLRFTRIRQIGKEKEDDKIAGKQQNRGKWILFCNCFGI